MHGRLDEVSCLPNGVDFLGLFFRDLGPELFLECHEQFDDVEAVGIEVIRETRVLGDCVSFLVQVLGN